MGYSTTETVPSLKKLLGSSPDRNKTFMLFNSYGTPGHCYHYFITNTAVGTSVTDQEPLAWLCTSFMKVTIPRWAHPMGCTVKFTLFWCWPALNLLLPAQKNSFIPVHSLRCCWYGQTSPYSNTPKETWNVTHRNTMPLKGEGCFSQGYCRNGRSSLASLSGL